MSHHRPRHRGTAAARRAPDLALQPILGLRPDRGPEPGPHRAAGDGADRPALTMVPRRPFGRTRARPSRPSASAATISGRSARAGGMRIVHAAIDAGITFLDNAWEYHDGASEERMGKAIARPARERLPDDQGVHARPRREGRDAAARGVAAPAEDRLPRPVAGPRVRLRQRPRAPLRRGRRHRGARRRRSSRARCASSASPATRTRRSTCKMLSYGYPFDACRCRSTASTPASAASSGRCCPS